MGERGGAFGLGEGLGACAKESAAASKRTAEFRIRGHEDITSETPRIQLSVRGQAREVRIEQTLHFLRCPADGQVDGGGHFFDGDRILPRRTHLN
jgi:hypothetical protein